MNRDDLRALVTEFGTDSLRKASRSLARDSVVFGPVSNDLSLIGNAVSREIRRSILLYVLEDTRWNIRHTAELLNFSDSSGVRKEIKRLGLTETYEKANRRGPGGQLPRQGQWAK